MDAYAVLGLTEKATDEEIAKAYKKLAMEYHPDKNGGDDTRMLALNEAYSLIKTPELRKKYFNGNDFTCRFKWMEAVFGKSTVAANFGNPPTDDRSGSPGSDIELEETVSLRDFIFGGRNMEVKYAKSSECLMCSGIGGEKRVNCPSCGATGKIVFRGRGKKCPKCDGSGYKVVGECQNCHGIGMVDREAAVSFSLVPGMMQFDAPGKGNEGMRGGPNGDLKVRITPVPDEERHMEAFLDQDGVPFINISAWIYPEDFILGTTLDFDVYGRLLSVDVPPNTACFGYTIPIDNLCGSGMRAQVSVGLRPEDAGESLREHYLALRNARNAH